ncbi:hypothetical protein G7Z17_g4246 [Cylindrodendrum hubeiense]|uniref:Uncharacterized protein n=1 Tax=Cylindrodendrum hubeiense TaxID=595255 RepID=A0A9P5LJ48_9HYPO|nr:hypothetical protein G7Z17_g4246 [Cylindrodendrum hubeiense]
MSSTATPRCRTIEVAAGVLPPPATRLVITQHLRSSQDPPFWALIIVGAFFDEENKIVWSTEVFAGHLDIQVESDDESVSSEGRRSQFQVEQRNSDTDSASAVYSADPPTSAHDSYDSHDSYDLMSGGWNPITGRDSTGTRPAFAPAGAPVPVQGQPYIPHFGGPGYNFGAVPQYIGGYGGMMMPSNQFPTHPYSFPVQGGYGGFQTQQVFSQQPNGTGNIYPRQPQPCPNIDSDMPAAQMTNSSGGVGCEPGYNYFFPAEHTKVHVFKTARPPWQLPGNTHIQFNAAHIPSNTTLGDLLKGYGCTNPTPKKNRCFELVNAGNGQWYKGFNFGGDDKDMLKKTLRDVGWDKSRTGLEGEKPIVCLWFCKN